MATKEALRKSALAALQTWPKDPLRPTVQLRDTLLARFANPPPPPPPSTPSSSSSKSQPPPPPAPPRAPEPQELQAIKALLANQFQKKYPLHEQAQPQPQPQTDAPRQYPDPAAYAPATDGSGGLLRPRSNPDYYATLVRDLEAAPTRTVGQSWLIRLKGLFRFE